MDYLPLVVMYGLLPMSYELTVSIAEKSDDIVRSIIQPRRAASSDAFDDVTTRLCRETINGQLLDEFTMTDLIKELDDEK